MLSPDEKHLEAYHFGGYQEGIHLSEYCCDYQVRPGEASWG